MKPALFNVLCEIKEKTGKFSLRGLPFCAAVFCFLLSLWAILSTVVFGGLEHHSVFLPFEKSLLNYI